MSSIMEWLILESTSNLVGIISTIGATLFVAILAYVAQFIIKSGDITAEIKRMAYIDAREVRLRVHFSSTKKKESECNDLFLAAEIDGVLLPLTEVAKAPLADIGSTGLITRSEHGYGFKITSRKPFDGYFDFIISRDIDLSKANRTYLVCTDEKGRKRKAEFVLSSTASQSVNFRKM
ncbi:MAG: hypothetical protein K6B65_02310 [Bacilli bacterium]|nr:hypothetical protein [Bacilli bacterium]